MVDYAIDPAQLNLDYGGSNPLRGTLLDPSSSPDVGDISQPNMWGQNKYGSGVNGFGKITEGLGSSWDSFKGLFGNDSPQADTGGGGIGGGLFGNLSGLLSAGGGVAQAVMAGQQNKLAKDMLNFQKGSYNENNRLQAQALNRQLENRQVADVSQQGAAAYEARRGDADQYLADNKVTPRNL